MKHRTEWMMSTKIFAPDMGTGTDTETGTKRKSKPKKPMIYSIAQEIIDDYPEIGDDDLVEDFLKEVKDKPKRLHELAVFFLDQVAPGMRPKPEKPEPTPEQQAVHDEALAARRRDYKVQLAKLGLVELIRLKLGERTGGEVVEIGRQMLEDASEKSAFAELVIKLGRSVGFDEKISTLSEEKITAIGFTEEAFRKFMA
jgi:hypothetical protein